MIGCLQLKTRKLFYCVDRSFKSSLIV